MAKMRENTFHRLIWAMWAEHRGMVTKDFTYHSFIEAPMIRPKVTQFYDGWVCGYDVIAKLDMYLKLRGAVTKCTDYKMVRFMLFFGAVTMPTSNSVSFFSIFAYAFQNQYIVNVCHMWGRWSGQNIPLWQCKSF